MNFAKSRYGLVLATLAAATFSTAVMAEGGPDGGGAMMLQRFDQVDTDKDGFVTEAEMAAYRAANFAAADADGNGTLSVDELSAMQMQQMQDRMAQRAAKMMKRLDANADGQLSAEELAARGKSGKGKSMLQRIDADGDGKISKAEAEAAVQRMAERRGKHGKADKQD